MKNKVNSFLVFMAILSVEVYGAAFSINHGWQGQWNGKLVAELYQQIARPSRTSYLAEVKGITSESLPTANTLADCGKITLATTSIHRGLVPFLKENGFDYSYTGREQLAQKLGIEDYRGTTAQNIKIYNLLVDNGTCGIAASKNI